MNYQLKHPNLQFPIAAALIYDNLIPYFQFVVTRFLAYTQTLKQCSTFKTLSFSHTQLINFWGKRTYYYFISLYLTLLVGLYEIILLKFSNMYMSHKYMREEFCCNTKRKQGLKLLQYGKLESCNFWLNSNIVCVYMEFLGFEICV